MSKKMTDSNEIVTVTNAIAMYAKFGVKTTREILLTFFIWSNLKMGEDGILRSWLPLGLMAKVSKLGAGKRSGSAYSEIRELMKTYMERNYMELPSGVYFNNDKTKPLPTYMAIFDTAAPEKRDGIDGYAFEAGRKITPFMVGMVTHFLKFPIPFGIQSRYTARGYPKLMAEYQQTAQHRNRVRIVWSVDEDIEGIMGARDIYPNIAGIKRRIIEPLKKEVNNIDVLHIANIEYLKTGRKVTHVAFDVEKGSNYYSVMLGQEPPKLKVPEGQTQMDFVSLPKKKARKDLGNYVPTEEEEGLLYEGQYRAYMFLKSKEVLPGIAYRQIVKRISVENVEGFEDIYIKIVWNIFEAFTKAKTTKGKAKAFTSMWSKGTLLQKNEGKINDLFYGRTREMKLKEEDRFYKRKQLKEVAHIEFLEMQRGGGEQEQTPPKDVIKKESEKSTKGFEQSIAIKLEEITANTRTIAVKKVDFNYKEWKKENPELAARLRAESLSEIEREFKGLNNAAYIEQMVENAAEIYFKGQKNPPT